MAYIALKRFAVKDGFSVPGEVCKEVENWKDPKKWENWGYIIKEELFDPNVHLKRPFAKVKPKPVVETVNKTPAKKPVVDKAESEPKQDLKAEKLSGMFGKGAAKKGAKTSTKKKG